MNLYFAKASDTALDTIINLVPAVLGFVLLILVGWLLAAIAKRLTTKLLDKLHFEQAVAQSPAGNYVTRIVEQPNAFVGKTVYWVIFLAFLSFALSSLNVPAITLMVTGVYRYIPNVIAAILIFLVASAITAGAEAFVQKVLRGNPLAKVIGAVIPALTMSIAVFMILNQLKIAQDIVNITYTALMGSVALGLALAFGLGGRDVAAKILNQAYDKTLENSDTIKQQVRQAKADTRRQAERAKSNLPDNI